MSDIIADGNAGSLAPDSDEEAYYDDIVATLRTGATNSCYSRASDIGTSLGTVIQFDGAGDVSCLDAASDEVPYLLGTKCAIGPCEGYFPVPGTGGLPEPTATTTADTTADTTAGNDDGGMHVYGIGAWADVIDVDGSTYEFDSDFVGNLLGDLTVFSDDNIGIGSGTSSLSNRGFEFETVGEDSIADALGFEEGDIVWELNGSTFEDIDDVTEAFETLQLETVFTIKLDRGSTTLTRTIKVTDLTTYP
ncbi:MAG: hypothetical protein K0V04_26135 [Deltaproteobacteria bacterium]|nr:hypothetical protein [Deltaproteobacteria bacterium]